MPLSRSAIQVLRETSRTFFIPIIRLPGRMRDAVGSAYLCMRSIDEIEDHPSLDSAAKIELLNAVSDILRQGAQNGIMDASRLDGILTPHQAVLPRVTLDLGLYAGMAPASIADAVWRSTSAMAREMGRWVRNDFHIQTEADLDAYTYDVAGRVGVLLTEIWRWHDGTETSRENAVGFGRGLQAVNIARNRTEDLARGVDFYPDRWEDDDLHAYILRQFAMADAYMEELGTGPARDFCQIPLRLAKATLDALASGREKLSREEVCTLVGPTDESKLEQQ